jgi:hypothetical protein
LDLDAADLKTGQAEAFALSLSILAKGSEDFALLKAKFAGNMRG